MSIYKLLDWIPEGNLILDGLSHNPNAIEMLEKNIDKININCLAHQNPNAMQLLVKVMNIYGNDWCNKLSRTSNKLFLEKHIDKIDWWELSINPNAISILEKNLDKVSWNWLSCNENAIHLLEKNMDKIDWGNLSGNPNAIHLLEKNLNKVSWSVLSGNPNALHILEKNMDKVSWKYLSCNINAIHILEKNMDKIDWYKLSCNEGIFELDLNFFKKRMDIIREELMMKLFHPTRFEKYLMTGYDICCDEYTIS